MGVAALYAVVATGAVVPAHAEPVRVIFDTDMGNDVDDALALAMLHALHTRGECELLAVTVSKQHPLAAAYVDAVNAFYGRGDLPVGLVGGGVTPEVGKFIGLAEVVDEGRPRYPNRFTSQQEPPPAVEVLRRTLAKQPDGSVTIVQVGFSTNLAQLLDSPGDEHSPLPGRELAAAKVRELQVMAGNFDLAAGGDRPLEYNVVEDVASARRLVEAWPTPIVFSGFEVGRAIEYPLESIRCDYRYVDHHPVAEAYQLYCPPNHDRPTWDLTSVLQAVRPERGYFGLSAAGRVTIDERGATSFAREVMGTHRYLTVSPEQIIRVREAFCVLASQPPAGRGD